MRAVALMFLYYPTDTYARNPLVLFYVVIFATLKQGSSLFSSKPETLCNNQDTFE